MRKLIIALVLLPCFYACKTPVSLFIKKAAHEAYADKLTNAGLQQTALGDRWFNAASGALARPITVELPYKENGYFATERPDANGLRFDAKRGEQLVIELIKTPAYNYLLFADLFSFNNNSPKYILSVDTISNLIRYTVKENSVFILRLQPELLQSGSYTVTIKTGPSLAYPIPSPGAKNQVISFWGAGRDGGVRKHEGIDIGGARGTPLAAVGNGVVSSVTENNLGGKVVFIRSAEGNETWYYAHLDSQIARSGQRVKTGDIIGLMGNTGNAKTTAPHLHFGIYTIGGAVDPLPFINPESKEAKPVAGKLSALGKKMRVSGKSPQFYLSPVLSAPEKATDNLPVSVIAATGNLYKAILPGGETRFINLANVVPLEKPLRRFALKADAALTDAPATGAPVIERLKAGSLVNVLGTYSGFQYVNTDKNSGWISN